jgi:hypothetical protein
VKAPSVCVCARVREWKGESEEVAARLGHEEAGVREVSAARGVVVAAAVRVSERPRAPKAWHRHGFLQRKRAEGPAAKSGPAKSGPARRRG